MGLQEEFVSFVGPIWNHRQAFFGAVLAYFAFHLLLRVMIIPTLVKRGSKLSQNFLASRLRPRQELTPEDLPKVEASLYDDLTVRGVATVFALVACPVTVYILCTCTPSLMTNFYERDARSEVLMIWTTAFFVWDLVICIKDDYGTLYIMHGAAALFVFLSGMREGGFCHWMATAVILFESSTPFLHARKIYFGSIGWNPKRAKALGDSKSDRIPEPPVGKALSIAFAAAFFLSRIAFGWPAAAVFIFSLGQTILEGRSHSVAVCGTILVLNTFFCVLNGYWMYQMMAGILSQDDRKEEVPAVTPVVEPGKSASGDKVRGD